MWNVIICTSSFDKKNIDIKLLKKKIELKFNKFGRKLKENELYDLIDQRTVGIISGTEKITKKILDKGRNLQVISRCGTGTDNIDKSSIKNIKIFKTDKEPVLAVAEFVVTQVLSTLKNSYLHNYYLKNSNWRKIKGKMLTNSNVGIIGFGKIGKQIQLLLKPFKCKITIYDPKIRKFSSIRNLNFILKNSEIITLNIPFNKKNKNFINAQKLKQMSKNTILVNCSRGGLIDEKALHKKLKKNKNFKVVLDCFDVEPYYGELIKLENAILSPHVASYTKETRDKMEKNSFISCLKNINFKKLNE